MPMRTRNNGATTSNSAGWGARLRSVVRAGWAYCLYRGRLKKRDWGGLYVYGYCVGSAPFPRLRLVASFLMALARLARALVHVLHIRPALPLYR